MSPFDKAKSVVGCALNGVPFILQRRVVESALNAIVGEALARGELDFLEGRCVKITVDDLNVCVRIGLREARLRQLPVTTPWDVHIAGNARSFFMMAAGREDPNTLFFQRRLKIVGDTELGLAIKNTMDGIGPLSLSGLSCCFRYFARRIGSKKATGRRNVKVMVPRCPGRDIPTNSR